MRSRQISFRGIIQHGRSRGFTLLELLVAMTIMVILGTALVVLLQQGIRIWHVAETRGAIYDRARLVLDQIAEDLRAAAGDSRAEGAGFWVRFLCDTDAQGMQRLRFVRAISGEAQDGIAREGGKLVITGAGAYYDLHGDAGEAKDGTLLAPAGYQEVLYVLDPDPSRNVLWRGLRAPIGGGGSFFIDRNVEEEDAGKRKAPPRPAREADASPGAGVALAESAAGARSKSTRAKSSAETSDETPLERVARPVAEEILFVSFAFWTPFTTTWDPSQPPRLPSTRQQSGAIGTWDSTRAILDEKVGSGEFGWRRTADSLEDSSDDLFPERVQITLVVKGNADARAAKLAADLSASDREIELTGTEGFPEEGLDRFVKIDGEWIWYERIEGLRLVLPSSKTGPGRGARGTAAARHERGAEVELGTTFRRVVEIPAARIAASELEAEGRRK